MSAVEPHMLENGWEFEHTTNGTSDPLNNCRYLHEVYTLADPDYTGRVTVPTLSDKERGIIFGTVRDDTPRQAVNPAYYHRAWRPGIAEHS